MNLEIVVNFCHVLSYIHYNPVEEGLVFRPEEYVYSSAVYYSGQNGLLEITLLS